MLHVAVCATGTSGDHRRLMAIALELARRGDDVSCIVHPQLASALRLAIPFVFRRELDDAAAAIRASLGLPPQRDAVLRWLESHHARRALWDEALRPPLAGDPPELVTCGFPFVEGDGADASLPSDVVEFLEAEPRAIVCALGTTAGPLPVQLTDRVVEACELADRRALVIGDRPPTRTRESRWVASAPHAPAFRNAALVVHHAGMGTLSEVLRAGRVSLALPFANDPFDNAVRLRALGVGSIVRPRAMTARGLGNEIRRLLEDGAARREADRLGARVRDSDGHVGRQTSS